MPNFGNDLLLTGQQEPQNQLARQQSEQQERKDQNEENDMRRMRTNYPGGQARENSPNSREENMIQ